MRKNDILSIGYTQKILGTLLISVVASILAIYIAKIVWLIPIIILPLLVFILLPLLNRNKGVIKRKYEIAMQKTLVDIQEDQTVNITTRIKNMDKRLFSKHNHSLRSHEDCLHNVKIRAFDSESELPNPEMIQDNARVKSFYVIFRKSLKRGEEYEYTWVATKIPKESITRNRSWEYTPNRHISLSEIIVKPPLGKKVIWASMMDKSTGEEIAVAETKIGENGRSETAVKMEGIPAGLYSLKWKYENETNEKILI